MWEHLKFGGGIYAYKVLTFLSSSHPHFILVCEATVGQCIPAPTHPKPGLLQDHRCNSKFDTLFDDKHKQFVFRSPNQVFPLYGVTVRALAREDAYMETPLYWTTKEFTEICHRRFDRTHC